MGLISEQTFHIGFSLQSVDQKNIHFELFFSDVLILEKLLILLSGFFLGLKFQACVFFGGLQYEAPSDPPVMYTLSTPPPPPALGITQVTRVTEMYNQEMLNPNKLVKMVSIVTLKYPPPFCITFRGKNGILSLVLINLDSHPPPPPFPAPILNLASPLHSSLHCLHCIESPEPDISRRFKIPGGHFFSFSTDCM